MSSLPSGTYAPPQDTCATCEGLEVVVRPSGDWAEAQLCPACQGPVCRRCGGKGYRLYAEPGRAATVIPCGCKQARERVQRYNEARIPARYALARIEGFDDRNNASLRDAKLRFLRLAQRLEPGVRGIGLSGPVGTGKTHLVTGLVRDCTLVYGLSARFVEFTHLLTEIKRGFDAGRSGTEIIESLVEVPILVIDEMGKGLATEWQLGVLDELVSRRYNRGATLFFTTNFPFEPRPVPSGARNRDAFAGTALSDRVGQRIFSRLVELCDLVRIEADDYRATQRQGAHGRS